MATLTDDIRSGIMAQLNTCIGDGMTAKFLSQRLKVGQSSLRHVLIDMEMNGIIRKATGERYTRYFIPSQRQIEAMQPKPSLFKPLKPRTVHHAVIERIRNERDAIKSIY